MGRRLLVLFAFFAGMLDIGLSAAGGYPSVQLSYVVEIPGSQTLEAFHPPYIWAAGSQLVVPIRRLRGPAGSHPEQDLRFLILDLESKRVVVSASFENVRGATLIQTRDRSSVFIAVDAEEVEPRSHRDPPFRVEDYRVDVGTGAVTRTTLDTIIEERAATDYGTVAPYPSVLTELDTTAVYRSTELSAQRQLGGIDWERWGDLYVAVGAPVNDDTETPLVFQTHDLRLYDNEGRTRYVLSNIFVVPENLRAIRTTLQVSPDSRYLMVSPQNLRAHRQGLLDVRQPNVLLIYELVSDQDVSDVKTIRYTIRDTTGEGAEPGTVIEVESAVIDGSAMSTGPVRDADCER